MLNEWTECLKWVFQFFVFSLFSFNGDKSHPIEIGAYRIRCGRIEKNGHEHALLNRTGIVAFHFHGMTWCRWNQCG